MAKLFGGKQNSDIEALKARFKNENQEPPKVVDSLKEDDTVSSAESELFGGSVQKQPSGPGPKEEKSIDLPSWAVEDKSEPASTSQNAVAETLEDIQDKYYDAKLNSLIIDQVKELIEIDNNLNMKIDDVQSQLKKEVSNRESLQKEVAQHLQKIKELEQNMEKFVGLYEVVTNQFNPFVDHEDAPPVKQTSPVASTVPNTPPAPVRAPDAALQAAPVAPLIPASTTRPVDTTKWTYCPVHDDIPSENHFELMNGQKLTSIYDLLSVLESMSTETFKHHVTLERNDFAVWVEKALHLSDLSAEIKRIKTQSELLAVIRSYVAYHQATSTGK